MYSLLLVMAGGAIGSGARFLTGQATLAAFGPGWPSGTLTVNLVGSLLMGVLAGILARAGTGGEAWGLLLGTGMLGGFTTFSAFALDTVNMAQRGDGVAALSYVLVSVIGGLIALFAGMMVVRAVSGTGA